jgi:uncharacterized protein YeaO (DUF488 family)
MRSGTNEYGDWVEVDWSWKENLLSAKALAVLTVAVTRDITISGESLGEYFKEGRDALRKAIKELKDRGYVRLTREKIKGEWISINRVTPQGVSYLSESLNLNLWSRELVVHPSNQLKEFEEQLSLAQKIELVDFVQQEIKKVTEGS